MISELSQSGSGRPLTIAIVGDVHDAWDSQDEIALKKLGARLVLLVGDFGNESVEVVRAIANMSIPKAVILGNHDAWYTATDWGRKMRPAGSHEDRVQQQIDLLGVTHVGYNKLDFPEFQLSVVGARPFSWGGSVWKYEDFYRTRYHVHSFEESTARIVDAARQTAYDTVLFIGHCGPSGLGDEAEDPCGRDWKPLGGDFGDPDFEAAIAQTRALGKNIPLVAFGHMHHHLRHTNQQLRTALKTDADGTVYVNAANVPRIIRTEEDCLRNFTLVTLKDGAVFQVALVWLNQDLAVQSKQIFYQQPFPVAEAV
ncbi:MAG TPA: TIGR04168 family protein [Crinalium sp.]|jgi:uncharacterized protein (TIGR04168 family)